jgi:hypothetical protein
MDAGWVVPAWLILHALDYYLTLAGARLYRRAGERHIGVSGSYELNPIFRKPVDRLAWHSPRFFVSWLGVAALLWLALRFSVDEQLTRFVLGVIVFTRLAIIAQHLRNIWWYSKMAKSPSSISGRIVYSRRMAIHLSAHTYFGYVLVLAVAALCTPSAWLLGGALGMTMVFLQLLIYGMRASARAEVA